MTGKERVLAAFNYERCDKVPRWCGASKEFWGKAKAELKLADEGLRVRFGDDFRRILAPYKEGRETPFGIVRSGVGYGIADSHPLAGATQECIDGFEWPNADDVDVSRLKEQARSWNGNYALLGGDWSPFWHDAIDLIGMENFYFMMYDSPDLVDVLLDRIVDYYVETNRRIFDEAADEIDIFFIGNDFGSQTGSLLGVDLFDRFIMPQLQRLINVGHDYNLLVQLHCCGGFEPLLPSMINGGLDAVHAIQPCCHGMDLRVLKENYGDKIVFNGGIDSHHVLLDGSSPEFVRQKTIDTLDIMASGSGYIAGASHDSILVETPVENVLAMFDAIEEYSI